MTENAAENHDAYDDHFGLDVEADIGRELTDEEVEELLNGN